MGRFPPELQAFLLERVSGKFPRGGKGRYLQAVGPFRSVIGALVVTRRVFEKTGFFLPTRTRWRLLAVSAGITVFSHGAIAVVTVRSHHGIAVFRSTRWWWRIPGSIVIFIVI